MILDKLGRMTDFMKLSEIKSIQKKLETLQNLASLYLQTIYEINTKEVEKYKEIKILFDVEYYRKNVFEFYRVENDKILFTEEPSECGGLEIIAISKDFFENRREWLVEYTRGVENYYKAYYEYKTIHRFKPFLESREALNNVLDMERKVFAKR